MKKLLVALVFVLVASNVHAEEPTPAWPAGAPRKAADYISSGIVFGQIGNEIFQDFRSDNSKKALLHSGIRLGGVVLLSEVTKRLVHRTRPDGSDNLSFFSEHTAISAATTGLSIQFSVPLGTGVGYLRQAADKHHPTDVIVGALVGSLSHFLVP